FGSMDPMFFTANNIMGNYRYMASCLDEWTGVNTMIIKRTENIDTNYYADRGDGNGTYTYLTSNDGRTATTFNTVKYGSMAIRNNGSGNGYIYVALYDDDSRVTSPTPRLYLTSGAVTGYALSATYVAQRITNSNNPGPWNSVSLLSTGHPVVVYYTQTNNKLNMSYNNSTFLPTTFTNLASIRDGGKYCSVAADSSNLISISYQNNLLGLSYLVYNNVSDGSPVEITLETAENDGITGFNTSIALSGTRAPYISYINNSLLNTKKALHLAKFNGTTITKAELTAQTNWEYMTVPSTEVVNSEKTVIKWDGTNNRPVIAYKGNNYIWLARLVF
ncbi:MAG: hypothetical protein JXB50_12460, partial [Spirochaetes bacterium]|nr:hypothetical protein [Spirochaetota bacterium]